MSAPETVSAQRGRVARVALLAVVDKHAASDWIALVAFSTGACSGMTFREAVSVRSAALPHDARINAFVLVADLIVSTVLVVETFSLLAADP